MSSAKEEFQGKYVTVEFDGAEGIGLWFVNPDTEHSSRIMLDEIPEFIDYLEYWFPGMFYPRVVEEQEYEWGALDTTGRVHIGSEDFARRSVVGSALPDLVKTVRRTKGESGDWEEVEV